MPSFILLIFLLIQAGLYFHAANIAHAVASTTARDIASYRGSSGTPYTRVPTAGELTPEATAKAISTWQQLDGNHTMAQPAVRVQVDNGGSNLMVVTITSTTVNLLPGLFPKLEVTARAGGPIEVFKQQGTN